MDIDVEPTDKDDHLDTSRLAFGRPILLDDPQSEGTKVVDGGLTVSPVDGNYTVSLGSILAVGKICGLDFGDTTMFDDTNARAEADLLIA